MNTRAVLGLTAASLVLLGSAVAGVRFFGVGQTRPVQQLAHVKHGMANPREVLSKLPPLLPYIPNYYSHVRPILEQKCVGCHTQNGIAPMVLNSPEMAVKYARAAQLEVQAKRMPPFLPGGESPAFRDDARLSENEIAIIANWSWAGAPLGKLENAAPVLARAPAPKFDLTVDIGRDFQPQSDYSDEYRCFLIDPQLTEPRWIKGYDVLPGNRQIVHHVIAYQVTGRFVEEAKQLEAKQDGRGGWTCFGGPNIGTDALRDVAYRAALSGESSTATSGGNIEVPNGLLGYVGSWVPGVSGVRFPEGTGVLLRPGAKLVVQVHYNLLAGNGKDRTAFAFQFADKNTQLKPLGLLGLASPVEIPCAGAYPTDPTDPCHREAAYKAVEAYQEPWLTGLFKGGLLQTYCKQSLPTRGSSGKVQTTCDFPVSKTLLALGTQGHMHTRGVSLKIEVNPDSVQRKVALDIPRYDFHWQSSYFFAKPLRLEKGDVVRMTCVFDNSAEMQPWQNGVQQKPRYIVWGESTQDEMCVGNLQTIAAN